MAARTDCKSIVTGSLPSKSSTSSSRKSQRVTPSDFREVDVDLAVRAILAPILMASIWKHSFEACERGRFAIEPFLETSIGIYLRGVAAAPDVRRAAHDTSDAPLGRSRTGTSTTAPDKAEARHA